ncbi:MFS transporter [Scatolibacter rhodanostii]|uniref:MFS transporter n=1 Tax=Scatolibacter rhodanostii TaxID=2014781 RepID=UPI000C069C37|nr:MFS transporter [Scatolibacter rhodanostii]
MKLNYKHTLYACFCGYICQAIVSNLPPLLFVIFQAQLGVSLEKITLLITVGFCIQILVDFLAAKIVDIFGYRISVTIANLCCLAGLLGMSILPMIISPFIGLLIGVTLNSVGGGFIEVVVNPIAEALPGDKKSGVMGILHSFYCWGYVAVVLLSTLFFTLVGEQHWYLLAILWCIVPLFNLFLFLKVPMKTLVEKDVQIPSRKLFSIKTFWMLFVLMVCAGAAEQAMSKWSSFFAEIGLGTSKTLGDLLGPCSFAFLMGITRLIYGKKGAKYDLRKLIAISGGMCIFSYLLVSLSPIPAISLVGCALTGLSIAILWPATISLSSKLYPNGGNAMFGYLALGGDIGCAVGPSLVGFVSNIIIKFNYTDVEHLFTGVDITQSALKVGLFTAIVFPIVILLSTRILKNRITIVSSSLK